jgi:hypothetical protein
MKSASQTHRFPLPYVRICLDCSGKPSCRRCLGPDASAQEAAVYGPIPRVVARELGTLSSREATEDVARHSTMPRSGEVIQAERDRELRRP